MKKILTVAIAAAIAAPMASSAADTVLYGKINNGLVRTDASGTDANWDVVDNASRVGIKASEDLGNGMKAVLQFEFAADSDAAGGLTGGRLAYAGLAGGFGTVALGQQWTPYYGAVDVTDIFSMNATANDHYSGLFRTADALAYVSPNFGGVTIKAAAVMDGSGGEDGIDAYNASIGYSNAGLSVALGVHEDQTSTGTADRVGLGIKYAMDTFAVMAQYEDMDEANETYWGVAASANFGNNVAKIAYGSKDDGTTDDSGWALGMDHNFTKRTKVYVEYHNTEIGTDTDSFGVGIQHVF